MWLWVQKEASSGKLPDEEAGLPEEEGEGSEEYEPEAEEQLQHKPDSSPTSFTGDQNLASQFTTAVRSVV